MTLYEKVKSRTNTLMEVVEDITPGQRTAFCIAVLKLTRDEISEYNQEKELKENLDQNAA